jgi:hypothetical protein
MAQNQATGGNSMAAMLGNLQPKTQRPGQWPSANYGAGMQQPMQGRGPAQQAGMQPQVGGMQPIPPGGPGYPQMTPEAMQNLMGSISAQRPKVAQQGGPPGNMLGGITQGPASLGMPRPRMPAPGAPGLGAGGGKNQQIAQLPGAPPMGR